MFGWFCCWSERLRLLRSESSRRRAAFGLLEKRREIGITMDSCSCPLQMRHSIQVTSLVYQQFSERQMRKGVIRYDLARPLKEFECEGWMVEPPIALREIQQGSWIVRRQCDRSFEGLDGKFDPAMFFLLALQGCSTDPPCRFCRWVWRTASCRTYAGPTLFSVFSSITDP